MKKHFLIKINLAVILSILLSTVTMCGPKTITPTGLAKDDHQDADGQELPKLSPVELKDGEKLQVVATTSLIHDVVANIGGDLINLTRLIPVGSDPHGFEPRPQDMVQVTDAHVVFANGVGLEVSLDPLFESAGAVERIVYVSNGIDLLQFKGGDQDDHGKEEDHHHDADPHTWTDPTNVMVWVDNIEQALNALDPAHADQYEANAQIYRQSLEELDNWVRSRVAEIPEENRLLVTDHLIFGYFADEYGFEQLGAVVPGYSSMAEPSAQELAKLLDAIQQYKVKAIFVGNTVNPSLAETVSQDTGTRLITIYTGSLSDKDGEAPTYLDYIRYNVNAIVEGLE
ncbi:MAG: zinc ABC transporter substrate-binding protein [Anaerolineales bacterium]|nr:zinc ABC transporter substrate-binding protein [Anaerolineales bacterium]